MHYDLYSVLPMNDAETGIESFFINRQICQQFFLTEPWDNFL